MDAQTIAITAAFSIVSGRGYKLQLLALRSYGHSYLRDIFKSSVHAGMLPSHTLSGYRYNHVLFFSDNNSLG